MLNSSSELLVFSLKVISLVTPILVAGVVLIIILKINRLKRLNRPIDFGTRFYGQRLFGDNKTWKGVLVYVGVSVSACIVLWLLALSAPEIIHPIYLSNPLLLGVIFSLSYVGGELVNSFSKRRLGIKPGLSHRHPAAKNIQSFIDNVDGMLAVSVALILMYSVDVSYIVAALLLGIALHAITNAVMKKMALKS